MIAAALSLHDTRFETALGRTAFDAKGDITMPGYKVYAWKDGTYGCAD